MCHTINTWNVFDNEYNNYFYIQSFVVCRVKIINSCTLRIIFFVPHSNRTFKCYQEPLVQECKQGELNARFF